jgi:hypothetical protein
MRSTFKILTFSLLLICGIGQSCHAYDNIKTHQYINSRAVEADVSETDSILKNTLGFSNGIESIVYGMSIQFWFAHGGRMEDEPEARCLRHFHDPLKDWNEAGLLSGLLSLKLNRSSIVWAQASDNEYSWQFAKEYYYQALLNGSEESWVKTFRSFCGRLKDIDTLRRDVSSKWLSERTRLYAKKMGPDCDRGIGFGGSSEYDSQVWTVLRKGSGCRDWRTD